MIRDIVVSLSLGTPRDASGDFALSVATAVGAHLSGVAFAYEPIVGSMMFPVADASLVGCLPRWKSPRRRPCKAEL